MLDIIPGGQSFLRQLQPRDSILIADQVEYGFVLDSVRTGTAIALPEVKDMSNDTLTLVRGWAVDTLKVYGSRRAPEAFRIKAGIVLAPFEEGEYQLPDIPVARQFDGVIDTLVFEASKMLVTTMPVDTATFEIHDIKGQMRYPVTLEEVIPWVALAWIAAVLTILAVCLVIMHRRKVSGVPQREDPPYIVALRRLEQFRGDRFWAPEKQKTMYSGITDTLKEYIDSRFGIDAPEMTTAELFAALKSDRQLTPELWSELKDLFERADFVKFAKFAATDEENAKALPTAVRFVTETYQAELEEDQAAEGKEASH